MLGHLQLLFVPLAADRVLCRLQLQRGRQSCFVEWETAAVQGPEWASTSSVVFQQQLAKRQAFQALRVLLLQKPSWERHRGVPTRMQLRV